MRKTQSEQKIANITSGTVLLFIIFCFVLTPNLIENFTILLFIFSIPLVIGLLKLERKALVEIEIYAIVLCLLFIIRNRFAINFESSVYRVMVLLAMWVCYLYYRVNFRTSIFTKVMVHLLFIFGLVLIIRQSFI